jgi:hypothetical protein
MGKTFCANIGDGIYMTIKQYDILRLLEETYRGQCPPVKIENTNGHSTLTLKLMCQRDWIVPSWKLFDEERYSITGRGLKALQKADALLNKPPKGDLCFRCGTAPRYAYPTGRVIAYCWTCKKDVCRERYARKGTNYSPGICARCKRQPRDVTSNGYVYRHCATCRTQEALAASRRRAARLIAAKDSDNAPLCDRCHAAPIHVTPGAPNNTCKACNSLLRLQRRRQQKIRRMAQKMGLRKS